MANTYELIQTISLTGSQAAIDFTSIPGTYTDLVIIGHTQTSSSTGINMQFNGDTGSNYKFMYMFGDGTTPQYGNIDPATNLDAFFSSLFSSRANLFLSLLPSLKAFLLSLVGLFSSNPSAIMIIFLKMIQYK